MGTKRIFIKFTSWKERLQKQSILLKISTGSKETLDINDLYSLVDNWEWKLSACGFFDIDRKMASGVRLAVFLKYILISLEECKYLNMYILDYIIYGDICGYTCANQDSH